MHGEDLGSLDLAIEAAPVPLDPQKLEELARWRPQHGVLTIYVDADPTVQAHAAPPWRVQIDNELRAIEERLRSNGPRERWTAFSTMLDGTVQAREEITRAASPGRGRLLMLPLDGESAYALAIQRPLPTAVFLDEGPRLLPLMSALGRAAMIGVVLATKDRIDVAETRLGRVRQVETRRFSVDDDVADRRGPAAANPSRAQQTVSHVEKHERHVDARRERFTRSVMADVSTRRTEAGWEGVVIAGPPGVAETLGRALSETDARVVHHHIGDSEVADVVEGLASEIDDFAGEREAAALADAIDAARGGGHGVVGLEPTLDALNDGRVTHLFLPLEADRQGALLADGRIACDHGGDPSAVLVHSLFEAMLARALATGATVSVLSSGTADDVVAATRW